MVRIASHDDAGRYAPDGPYALARLALSLLIATLVGAGMWAVIVVLPQAQRAFGSTVRRPRCPIL